MASLRRTTPLLALGMSVALAAAACGTPGSAVRSEPRAAATTAAAATTTTTATTTATTTTTTPPRTTTTIRARPAPTTAPSTTAPNHSGAGVNGTVLFGPVCPVERDPPDPRCAPRPGPADIRLVRPDGSVAAQIRSGADGRFTLVVDPGRYTITASAPAPGPGRGCQADPADIEIVDGGRLATVTVTCDTGIR